MRSEIVQQAWDLFSARLYDQALQVAIKASGESPNDYEPYYIQSLCHINRNRFREGEEAARESIRVAPEQAAGHHALGFASIREVDRDAYNGEGRIVRPTEETPDLKDAEKHYLEAIRLSPQWAMLWSCYAWLLLLDHRPKEAEAAARKTLELDPGDASTHSVLGQSLRTQGRLGEAESVLADGLRLDPNSNALHTYMGWVMFESGRRQESMPCFRESLRLWPHDHRARFGVESVLVERYSLFRWCRRADAWLEHYDADGQMSERWIRILQYTAAVLAVFVAFWGFRNDPMKLRVILSLGAGVLAYVLSGMVLTLGYIFIIFAVPILSFSTSIALLMHPFGRLLLDQRDRFESVVAGGVAVPLITSGLLWVGSLFAGNYSATVSLVAWRLFTFIFVTPLLAFGVSYTGTRYWRWGTAIALATLLAWAAALTIPGMMVVFTGVLPWIVAGCILLLGAYRVYRT